MTFTHVGNNIFYGDNRSEIQNPSRNSLFINIVTGDISVYGTNAWTTSAFGARNDMPWFTIARQISFTNLSTTYVDLFGTFYEGFPKGIDMNGYTTMGFVVLWNKNGAAANAIHDLRIVTIEQTPRVLFSTESVRIANGWAQDGLKSGVTSSFTIPIPNDLETYRGMCKIQVKSNITGTNPIFDACDLYMLR
jgi:hypothetical protein